MNYLAGDENYRAFAELLCYQSMITYLARKENTVHGFWRITEKTLNHMFVYLRTTDLDSELKDSEKFKPSHFSVQVVNYVY